MWTQIRQSDLGLHCLLERLLKHFSRRQKQTTFVVIGDLRVKHPYEHNFPVMTSNFTFRIKLAQVSTFYLFCGHLGLNLSLAIVAICY